MKKHRLQIRDKKTINELKWWNILKKQAGEFCRETGLHGYKYISQTQRSKTERITWALVVFASLCCALVLMKIVWNYYGTHPTLTVIESTHHGIWNYPFPAITICDINRMSYSLTKAFIENLKIPSNVSKEFLIEEMQLMNELLQPGISGNNIEKNLTILQNIIDNNSLSIFQIMNLITRNCSSLLKICKWRSIAKQCDKLFKPSLSRDGLCCSFNYYIDTIKPENIKEESASCGYETGMTVLVNPEPNDYHATIIGTFGVKVMIHYKYDYPDYNAEIQLVRLNSQHFISINPAKMYSKSEVRDLAISTRKCIFHDENETLYTDDTKKDLIFAKYSYHNCLAKCRATIAKAKCGCIPYYFLQNSTRVCNLNDVQCLRKYKQLFDTSWPEMNLSYQNLSKTIRNIGQRPCGCIPDCDLLRYPVESSHATLDPAIYYNSGSYSKNSRNAINIYNHSIIHVFFNDLAAFQYRRSANYSWRNLFASFGGLLGLFAGFSLMSIFEFLYFFIIRVITDTYINSKKYGDT